VSAATPGQAAYEAFRRWYAAECEARTMTQDFNESKYEAMRRAFLAGTETRAIAAQQPEPAPDPDVCACGHYWAHHAFSDDVCAVADCPCTRPRPAQPAPELAAAMADRAELEDAYAAAHGRVAELEAERDRYRFALAQIASGAETAPDASRAGLGAIADRALEGK
jgi:hypothetical protein